MRIKFGEISISEKSKEHLLDCLANNHVTMGPKVALLEKKWSDLFKYRHTVAVSSGTSACMAANMSLYDFGAKPGDEVIVPALSFIATANAVRAAGLTPVFCDVKSDLLIDETKIEKLITSKTRAIMPVALMGKPPKMDVIRQIADNRELKVIVDNCMPPGEKVVTVSGEKNIEDVKVGDEVFTHKGNRKKVKELMVNDHEGDLYNIKTYGHYKAIRVTNGHPILCCKTKDILKSKDLKWESALNIEKGDYLVYPRIKKSNLVSRIDFSNYNHKFYKNSNSESDRVKFFESRKLEYLDLNEDILNICGWYLAEGWTQHSGACFSLGNKEPENLNSLLNSIEKSGFEFSFYKGSTNTIVVRIHHKQFSLFLADNFGDGAENKKLPSWVLDISDDFQKSLLFSYFKGDGHKVKDRITEYKATSISFELSNQLKALCHQLGYFAGISITKGGESFIQGRKVNCQDKYQIRFSTDKLNKFDRRWHMDDEYFYVRVRSVEKEQYKGKIYNFEVEDDHSYLTPAFVVSNCEGHGCSYQGRFMGHWADVVVYSCYAAHILFSGEMGFVSTNNDDIANAVTSIRSHGREPGSLYFDHQRYGLNLKPTDIHAAIGLGNIDDFWEIFETRKKNWSYLRRELLDTLTHFDLSDEDEDSVTSPHGFSIVVKRDVGRSCKALKKALDVAEIDWKRNFGCMATQHDCFKYLGYKLGDFPVAEYIGDNGIHIGCHQYLKQEDLEKIVLTIKNFIYGSR